MYVLVFIAGIVDVFLHDFASEFVSVFVDFNQLGLSLGLYFDKIVFHVAHKLFLFDDLALEFAKHFSYLLVLLLIDDADGLEGVGLMLSKHLALAAG